MTSLVEQLPGIVEEGRQSAWRLLEQMRSPLRPRLHAREWIGPPGFAGVPVQADWTNRLIEGDNLAAMAALLAGDEDSPSLRGAVDLIYIDPPFASQAEYRTRIRLPALPTVHPAGTTSGDTAAPAVRPSVIEPFAYSDLWPGGLPAYLRMLAPRIVLMRELLAETGSLYVHVDPVVGHYVKVMLDDVFGRERFQREIVWRIGWVSGFKSAAPNWIRNHDLIFYYTKTADFVFHKQHLPYAPDYVRRDGRRPTGAGYPVEDTWNCSELDRMDSIQIMSLSREKLGYDTQKNENLLARIIAASSNPGALVADFFAGSGTTAAVAERLGRRWLAVDAGRAALRVARTRLVAQRTQAFQRETVLAGAIDPTGVLVPADALSKRVLDAIGAVPLPALAEGPQALGEIASADGLTLVWIDPPDVFTGQDSVHRAGALRARHGDRWDRVRLLGWQLEPALGEHLAPADAQRIDVRRIPSSLAGAGTDAAAASDAGASRSPRRFEGIGQLEVEWMRRSPLPPDRDEPEPSDAPPRDQEELAVRLHGYRLPPAESLPLGDADRRRLLQAQQVDPLAAIDSWAVDADYDGVVFRPVWHGIRSGAEEGFRVPADARLVLPRSPGARRVCVRAIDVFGHESELVRDLFP